MHYTNLNFPADQTLPKAVGQREIYYLSCFVDSSTLHATYPQGMVNRNIINDYW